MRGDTKAGPIELPPGGIEALEPKTRSAYSAIDAAARRHSEVFAAVLGNPATPTLVREEIGRVLDSWKGLALSSETLALIAEVWTAVGVP